jgi:hypothetical protein
VLSRTLVDGESRQLDDGHRRECAGTRAIMMA